jgi:hypothetical protein
MTQSSGAGWARRSGMKNDVRLGEMAILVDGEALAGQPRAIS